MSQGGAEPATADLPPYCLGHKSSESKDYRYSMPATVSNYDLWPIGIPRPAHGRTTAAIVCGTCGRSYSYSVSSQARMRRARQRKRAAGLATIIAAVGCLLAVVILALLVSPRVLVLLGLVPAAVFLSVVACGTIKDPWVTGVRLRGDSYHQLRSPGSTVSVEYHDNNVKSEY
jgi:hypothetical protein